MQKFTAPVALSRSLGIQNAAELLILYNKNTSTSTSTPVLRYSPDRPPLSQPANKSTYNYQAPVIRRAAEPAVNPWAEVVPSSLHQTAERVERVAFCTRSTWYTRITLPACHTPGHLSRAIHLPGHLALRMIQSHIKISYNKQPGLPAYFMQLNSVWPMLGGPIAIWEKGPLLTGRLVGCSGILVPVGIKVRPKTQPSPRL